MATILIAGAAGDVGSAMVQALAARGARVRALVHATPVSGVENVRGDLADPASLAAALEGCDAAVFLTPHHAHEERLGHTFLDACGAARIRRLVYVSAFHPLARSRVVQRLIDTMIGFIGPHYRAKLRIERRVRAGAVALCPSNFFQNDLLALPEIRAGSYPNPIGHKPANRVDTRDIADAAAVALLGDLAPGSYPIVGSEAWTGERCAQAWSSALGTPVTYAGNDIERWRGTVGARMPAAKRHDFAKTYRVIQRFGIAASPRMIARTTELLGRPPRDFRTFVAEHATTA
jgi:uncharacterized protein YbjT (DUF2867 family)